MLYRTCVLRSEGVPFLFFFFFFSLRFALLVKLTWVSCLTFVPPFIVCGVEILVLLIVGLLLLSDVVTDLPYLKRWVIVGCHLGQFRVSGKHH